MTATPARDMHVGDLWTEHDWPLHISSVDVQGNNVAFAVREFPGTLMHRAAGDVLDITAAVR